MAEKDDRAEALSAVREKTLRGEVRDQVLPVRSKKPKGALMKTIIVVLMIFSLRPLALQERFTYSLTIKEYSRLIGVDDMGIQGTAEVTFSRDLSKVIERIRTEGV